MSGKRGPNVLFLAVCLFLTLTCFGKNEERASRPSGIYAEWAIYPGDYSSPVIVEKAEAQNYSSQYEWDLTVNGRVIATLKLPVEYKSVKSISIARGDCQLDGRIRNDIVAVVNYQVGTEWSSDIKAAWQALPKKKKFEPLKRGKIVCRNPDFGM